MQFEYSTIFSQNHNIKVLSPSFCFKNRQFKMRWKIIELAQIIDYRNFFSILTKYIFNELIIELN